MIKRYINILIAAAAVLASGCSLEVEYENQFSDPNAISTPTSARELLATAYSGLPNLEYDLSVLSDDFTPTYWANTTPTAGNAYRWQPQSLQDLSASAWPQYYSVIVNINAVLERLKNIPLDTDENIVLVNEIEAEAKTLKAYCYFQLLRLYGPDYAENADADAIVLKDVVEMQSLPRSSVRRSVEEIRRLLSEAIAVESRTMTSTNWLSADAARYLAAELELYSGNYDKAAEYASAVIANVGMDALSANEYEDLWSDSDCRERIFTYGDLNSSESFYLSIVYDKDMGDYFAVNSTLANSYDEGDCRKEWSIYPVTTSALGYQPYLGKYNAMRKQQKTISMITKQRLAGAVFVLAQAYALGGKESDAVELINDYLDLRGASKIGTNLRGDALLLAILTEKQKEFVGEGERFFDLKHYRRTILRNWTASQPADRRIAADDYRWNWPIPRDEYLYNENMSQNDGWPKNSFNE